MRCVSEFITRGRKAVLAALVIGVACMSSAQAGGFYRVKLSDVLASQGLQTLLLALDTAGLTSTLDSERVTLFAPTNDVFDELAAALGCTDAVALATGLADLGLLGDVLSYHAVFGRFGKTGLLTSGELHTVLGESLSTGVDANGLFVKGVGNSSNSVVTFDGVRGRRFVIYPINQILLPIAESDVVANAGAICP